MIRFSPVRIALYLLVGFVLVACVQPPSDVNIDMTLEMSPDPPVVGESELAITLTDGDGTAITDKQLEIVGDMNHAGMVPVVRDVETADEDGVYRVPFEWTMGGDWFVTVAVFLDDGSVVEKTVDMTVAMADDADMDHGEMDHGEGEGHSEDAHSEDADHGHGDEATEGDKDAESDHSEGDDDSSHSEVADHSHGDEAAKGDEDAEMEHSHDAEAHGDMTDMSKSINTSELHDIDEAARGGTIEPESFAVLQAFAETLNDLDLPDEYAADVEAVNAALADLESAMDAEDMDAATALISEMHDIAHDMKIRLTDAGREGESAEDDGHEHAHD